MKDKQKAYLSLFVIMNICVQITNKIGIKAKNQSQ